MNRRLLLLAVLCGITGCADTRWVNRDPHRHSQQQLERDTYECERENTKPAGFPVFGIPNPGGLDEEMYERCMGIRGWRHP